jgi:general secretion pathway protein D
MKAKRPAAIAALILALAWPLGAESPGSLYNKGKQAEAGQNYEQAFEFIKQAYDQKPQDLKYRAAYERLRFLAGASHVHRGQLLRDAGKLEEAMAEFQKAAQIDTSSFIALQEIKRTQQMMDAAAGTKQPGAAAENPLKRRVEQAAGPVDLAPIANVPIALKLTEDTKIIYETVGKLAGINVLFDPDYTSRRIRIELNSVTLEDALEIVSLESKTFWRPVTPNTIFIASDTPAKRKEIEQNVIKTFYLSNLSTPTELQDLVNALRTVLEIPRIQQLPAQSAIVVRGTPDQIALAQKMIGDIDKARPEVLVEVAIMQVSRTKMRNLGISPPTSASVVLQPNVTTPTTTTTTTTTGSTGSNTSGINLNRLANLNATDFQVTIPPASVTALMSDNNTKLIQNPQIRALDGQKASLKIGDRVPVATGSFQPGIGGVGINPLVNTQFQYLDVGVNIDITPRVHAGREVTLKLMLDVSSVTGTNNIGGINQPTIGQRKIEHEIRLKEGEVNLLGGIFEDSDIRSLKGIPGLAQIPFFKYLFSESDVEHRQNEIVFALIPHIIRGQEVSELNERAIAIGTGNAIELRRMSRPMEAPKAQPAAPVTPTPAPPQGQPTTPPAGENPAPAVAPQTQSPPPQAAAFQFDPPTIAQGMGTTFTLNLNIAGAQNVYAIPVQISYDPRFLQVVNVSNGAFLSQDGQAVALVHRDDPESGTLQMNATRPPGTAGVSGQGMVFTVTFMAKGAGRSLVAVRQGGARDPGMQSITVSPAQAVVTIQ